MTDNLNSRAPNTQAQSRTLIVGMLAGHADQFLCCPWSATIEGWSATYERHVLIALECKRWGCPVCGRKRITHLAKRCEAAEPTKLITLTTWTKAFASPRDAYDQTRRQIPRLSARIRERVGEFEYLRVLELHANGFPHYHFVARTGYLAHRWLSDQWAELAQSKIVDIRKIKQKRGVYSYITKYLAKQQYIPWTNRRVTASKNFYRDTDWEKPPSLKMTSIQRHDEHPAEWLKQVHPMKHLTAISTTAWLIEDDNELTARYAHSE